MKYGTTGPFDRDFARLPAAHREMFLAAVREHLLPAITAGAFTGTPPWPRRLRIHRLTGSGVYSLTWDLSSPDGRATFDLNSRDGETVLVWRRIGDHSIYGNP